LAATTSYNLNSGGGDIMVGKFNSTVVLKKGQLNQVIKNSMAAPPGAIQTANSVSLHHIIYIERNFSAEGGQPGRGKRPQAQQQEQESTYHLDGFERTAADWKEH
jgi:hypothetical protein